MKQSLALPFRLLRDEPRLVARFAIGSLGRSALTAGTILLIRDFLGGAVGARSAANGTAHAAGAGLWTVVLLLFVAFLGKSSEESAREFKPSFANSAAVVALTLIAWVFMNSTIVKPFVYFAF